MVKNKKVLNDFDLNNQEKQKFIQIVFCLNNQFIILAHVVLNQYPNEYKNKFAELKTLETNKFNLSSFGSTLKNGIALLQAGLIALFADWAFYRAYKQETRQFINKQPQVVNVVRMDDRVDRYTAKKLAQIQKSLPFGSTSSKFILNESNIQSNNLNLTKALKLNYLQKAVINYINSLKVKNKFFVSSLYQKVEIESDWIMTSNRLNLPFNFGAAAQTHFKLNTLLSKTIYFPDMDLVGVCTLTKAQLSNKVVFSTPPLIFSDQHDSPPFYFFVTLQHPSTNPLIKPINVWGELRLATDETGESSCSLRFDAHSCLFTVNWNPSFSKGTDQKEVVNNFLTKHKKAPYATTGFNLIPVNPNNVGNNNPGNQPNGLNNSSGDNSSEDLNITRSAAGEIQKITKKYKPVNYSPNLKMKKLQINKRLKNEELENQKLRLMQVLGGAGFAFIIGSLCLPNDEKYLKRGFQTMGVLCLLTTTVITSEVIEYSSNTAGQAITQEVIDPLVEKLEFILTEAKQSPIVNLFVLNALYNALRRGELFNDLNELKSFCQLFFQGGDDWFGFQSDLTNRPWDPDPDSHQTEVTLNTVCYGSINDPVSATFAKNIYPQVKNVNLKNVKLKNQLSKTKNFFSRFLTLLTLGNK